MDNEKLLKERNEKLALWSGFVFSVKVTPTGGRYYPSLINPQGIRDSMPDFEKVDECITWLLPKIERLRDVCFEPDIKGYYWSMRVSNVGIPFRAKTLVEAIEKYVDWVKENEDGKV